MEAQEATVAMATRFLRFFDRCSSAWAVFRAKRVLVITYDPGKPANLLEDIYYNDAHPTEVAERLANAARVAARYNEMDSEEGQWNALRRAREILNINPTR